MNAIRFQVCLALFVTLLTQTLVACDASLNSFESVLVLFVSLMAFPDSDQLA